MGSGLAAGLWADKKEKEAVNLKDMFQYAAFGLIVVVLLVVFVIDWEKPIFDWREDDEKKRSN